MTSDGASEMKNPYMYYSYICLSKIVMLLLCLYYMVFSEQSNGPAPDERDRAGQQWAILFYRYAT
jgi:hypothetical protein